MLRREHTAHNLIARSSNPFFDFTLSEGLFLPSRSSFNRVGVAIFLSCVLLSTGVEGKVAIDFLLPAMGVTLRGSTSTGTFEEVLPKPRLTAGEADAHRTVMRNYQRSVGFNRQC